MKKICPLPWLSLSTESQQELRLCCHETREVLSGHYLNNFSTPLDAFNIPFLKSARASMLKGELPSSCQGCDQLEKKTGHSPRVEYLERFKDELPVLLENTDKDGTLNLAKLTYLDVTTDNHCNLKCRMCRPRYSEKILKDWQSIGWNPGEDETRGIDLNKAIDTYKTSSLLKDSFQNIKMMTLTGGEPFLSEAVETLLDRALESGYASKISLRFFTNTTVFPKRLAEYLGAFKEVHLFCSIDAYGTTSNYIRFPSKWSTIEHVYKELLNLKDVFPNLILDLHTVVQAYNVTQMVGLLDFLASFKGKVPLLPSFTHVESSLPLAINYVPAPLLKKASEDFEEFLIKNELLIKSHHQAFHEREIKNFRSMLQIALERNDANKLIDLIIYSKKLDKLRGQSFETQYPEFKL